MKKNERNAGAKPKFPYTKTKKLRIERIVPEVIYADAKIQVSKLINQLQSEALTKCADEVLKSKQ